NSSHVHLLSSNDPTGGAEPPPHPPIPERVTAQNYGRRFAAGDVWGLVPPAVFKTVCGALLRRPGWVRFPSIPARFGCMTAKMTATETDPWHLCAEVRV